MKCDVKILNRLKRASGQLDGVLKMADDERSCEDMVMQLAAVRTSVDRIISLMTTSHLLNVLEIEEVDESIQDALDLIVKHR